MVFSKVKLVRFGISVFLSLNFSLSALSQTQPPAQNPSAQAAEDEKAYQKFQELEEAFNDSSFEEIADDSNLLGDWIYVDHGAYTKYIELVLGYFQLKTKPKLMTVSGAPLTVLSGKGSELKSVAIEKKKDGIYFENSPMFKTECRQYIKDPLKLLCAMSYVGKQERLEAAYKTFLEKAQTESNQTEKLKWMVYAQYCQEVSGLKEKPFIFVLMENPLVKEKSLLPEPSAASETKKSDEDLRLKRKSQPKKPGGGV